MRSAELLSLPDHVTVNCAWVELNSVPLSLSVILAMDDGVINGIRSVAASRKPSPLPATGAKVDAWVHNSPFALEPNDAGLQAAGSGTVGGILTEALNAMGDRAGGGVSTVAHVTSKRTAPSPKPLL